MELDHTQAARSGSAIRFGGIRSSVAFLLLLLAVFICLAGRCFYLQHLKSEHFRSISQRQQHKLVSEKPQRGEILDCRGRVLAASSKIRTVFAEPRIVKDVSEFGRKLGPLLRVPPDQVTELVLKSKNPGFVKLTVGASEDQCQRASKIYGVGIESQWQRSWPTGCLASHVVGFTSADNRGLGGIELEFDRELRGIPSQNVFFADAFRRPIAVKKQNGVLQDGAGIILTIDATIQQFARAELDKRLDEFRAESGVAIVAEPKTGAILATVSLPDYEPERAGLVDANNLRNRALTDQYEPGSILKPIVAAIALDAGVVNTGGKIHCEDGFYSGKGFGKITEYRNHRFGDMTVAQILIKSSNIGMAKVGQRLGSDRMYAGLRVFGFGRRTGVDLPGEVEGLLRRPGDWTGYSVTRIPFGQEISVTAMQLVRAFCVLANGGHAVRPHVVRAMVDHNGKVIKQNGGQRTRVGFVVKPEVAKWIVNEALVGVVNEGTGSRAKLEKWQVFGKTGTANIAKEDERGYSDTDYVASFIAGAPADDPAVLVLVSIRKPDKSLGKGYTGGAVASPVAAAILEKTLNYLKVPPTVKPGRSL